MSQVRVPGGGGGGGGGARPTRSHSHTRLFTKQMAWLGVGRPPSVVSSRSKTFAVRAIPLSKLHVEQEHWMVLQIACNSSLALRHSPP